MIWGLITCFFAVEYPPLPFFGATPLCSCERLHTVRSSADWRALFCWPLCEDTAITAAKDIRNLTNLYLYCCNLNAASDDNYLPNIFFSLSSKSCSEQVCKLKRKLLKRLKPPLITPWDASRLHKKMRHPETRGLGHLLHAFSSL